MSDIGNLDEMFAGFSPSQRLAVKDQHYLLSGFPKASNDGSIYPKDGPRGVQIPIEIQIAYSKNKELIPPYFTDRDIRDYDLSML